MSSPCALRRKYLERKVVVCPYHIPTLRTSNTPWFCCYRGHNCHTTSLFCDLSMRPEHCGQYLMDNPSLRARSTVKMQGSPPCWYVSCTQRVPVTRRVFDPHSASIFDMSQVRKDCTYCHALDHCLCAQINFHHSNLHQTLPRCWTETCSPYKAVAAALLFLGFCSHSHVGSRVQQERHSSMRDEKGFLRYSHVSS